MLLHQFLRHITNNTPIVLFDSTSKILFKCLDKRDINLNYYEDEIFQISCGTYEGDNRIAALHIMLFK